MKHMARYVEISMYMYLATKHVARYTEISMYFSYGYTNKAYMERSVYFTHKQVLPYLTINCSTKSCEI